MGDLSIRKELAGKHLFISGTTGFVGKVLLSMVAAELPDVRRVSVLVRPSKEHSDVRERFDAVVGLSEPFQAIAERIGNEALETWLEEKVNVVKGDVTFDRLGMSQDDYEELTERDPIDVILHVAGKVNFNPPLDQALAVNALGVGHKLDLAKAAGCGIVHMSTCFVAGARTDRIKETWDVVGYTPNETEFDAEREVKDAVALAEQVRARADAQAMERRFRDEAKEILTKKGLDYDNPIRLQEGFETCRDRWVDAELTREGTARANQWGWTNTYTYTKSMGEQLTLARAAEMDVPVTIVRPAIVESSRYFPFPGWNEGVNTSAPILYILWKGHRYVPSNPDNILDIVPVDYVARGTLIAAAELMRGEHKPVYQLSTGDVNPLSMKRTVELSNLYNRQDYEGRKFLEKAFLKQLEGVNVSADAFEARGAPAINRFAKMARGMLKGAPKGALTPVVRQLDRGLKGLEDASNLTATIMRLFYPFIHDNNPCFESKHVRIASERLVADEQAAFAYDLEDLDWRQYWMEVHLPGLRKWVFHLLDDKVKRERIVARAQDLIEVFHTATRRFGQRKALSHFTHDGGDELELDTPPDERTEEDEGPVSGVAVTYTYEEFWENACRAGAWFKSQGVEKGDRIVLMADNEPVWPMAYFGILLADAVAVPLDPEMPIHEATRIADKAEAKFVITTERDDLPDASGFGDRTRVDIGDIFEHAPMEEVEQRDRSDELASLLFTSGTTGDPKGVMLTHGNFTALLASLHTAFKVDQRDRFLSVLPLFHTFEFSCGLLLPLSVGAHITYLEEIEGNLLRDAMKKTRPTALIGVPALWDLLHRRIKQRVEDEGDAARLAFDAGTRLTRFLRRQYGINLGPMVFNEVHQIMGGRIRHLISGGAALDDQVMRAFEGLGFELLEGYGLTEAAPVLTVRRPGDRKGGGSVGKPVQGVEVRIVDPDEQGVGEVIAKGDNVMQGYLNEPRATESAVRKGWLHTGDLGKLDKDGRLILVGRRKEIIVTSSGKNVYPDELEPLYADHEYIEEMAIVGVPDAQGDEKVAALVVLTDDAPEDAMGVVRSHFNDVAVGLSNHQKLRLVKFWSEELPRTATRKVKRKEVRAELIRLIEVEKGADREDSQVPSGREPAWLYAAIAGLVGQEATDILPHTDLISDLGLSSLQTVELRLLIEERGGVRVDADDMAKCETVEDLASVVRGGKPLVKTHQPEIVRRDDGDYDVPGVISEMGRNVLKAGQKALYERAFDVRLEGEDNIPYNEQCIVVANHSSHIDAGLAKYALWDYAPELSPLAASDYFFDTKEKRGFFEPFTNLIPVDRSQPTERSLREAERAIQQGRVVLVFPEGTRSKDGQLQEFKHGIGYLMRKTRRPVLPLYMRGSHRALPKGAAMPRSRRLTARIGPIIRWEDLGPEIDQMEAPEVYKAVADKLHEAICALRDGTDYPWKQPAPGAEKKKQSGLADVFDELPERFDPNLLDKPITWYFSLGDRADGKWTVRVSKDGANIQPGKPNGGKADCVLKTDPRTFEKIVRERYVPSFAEFAEGKVKTNDPDLLRMFQTVFQL